MIVHHFALAFVFIPLILIRRDHEPGKYTLVVGHDKKNSTLNLPWWPSGHCSYCSIMHSPLQTQVRILLGTFGYDGEIVNKKQFWGRQSVHGQTIQLCVYVVTKKKTIREIRRKVANLTERKKYVKYIRPHFEPLSDLIHVICYGLFNMLSSQLRESVTGLSLGDAYEISR